MAIERQCRDLNKLCPCVRKLALDMIMEAKAAGISTTVIETLRGPKRQAHYVAIGVSWTMNSKHLPQKPWGLSLAFDLAPTSYLKEPLWNPSGSHWKHLRTIAEEVGLRNGGRWKNHPDFPHNYLPRCMCKEQG